MPVSPRYGFSYLTGAETDPTEAVNEILELIEAGGGHFIILDRDLSDPSALTPSAGDTYVVAGTGAGAWLGHDDAIAYRLNTGWLFITPIDGFTAAILDEVGFFMFLSGTWNLLSSPSGSYILTSALDTDGTLAANSDAKIASQKAVKTYVDGKVVGLLEFKGSTDCSSNPNFPAGLVGDAYAVSVAGKIGGASGETVDVGDFIICSADNAGGTEASVGASWFVLEHNLVSALAAAFATSSDVNAGSATDKVISPDALANSIFMPAHWAPNFTGDGDVYIPAEVAMTIDAGNAAIGTGTLAYEKSTTAAPGTFTSTSLPATLQAGAWLKVNASGVTGFVAAHLVRTA